MRSVLTTFFLAANALLAQQTSAAQSKVATGPALGSPIPSFQAPDQSGRQQDLASISGPKGAILVFYRSSDW